MFQEGDGTLRYTPVPDTIVSEASLAEAAHRVTRVSHQLALRGAAVIHTFVQASFPIHSLGTFPFLLTICAGNCLGLCVCVHLGLHELVLRLVICRQSTLRR